MVSSWTFRALLLCSPLAAGDPRVLFEKAQELQRAGNLAAAEKAYRSFLRQHPNSAEAYGNLGVTLAGQGQLAGAVEAYRSALRLNPRLSALHINLGLAYYKMEDRQSAVAEFRSYLRKDPANSRVRQLLATALLELDRASEAAELYQSLLSSKDPAVQLGLAAAYIRLHRTAEADALLESLMSQTDSAPVQLMLAQAYLSANDFSRADAALAKALLIDPHLPGIHFYLGASQWKQQNADAAIEHWREAVEHDATSFEAVFALGAALAARGDDGAAESLLERARHMRPASGPVLYHLGRIAFKHHRPEARSLLESSVKLDPGNRAAHYLLARLYKALGDKPNSDKHLAIYRKLSAKALSEDMDILESAAK